MFARVSKKIGSILSAAAMVGLILAIPAAGQLRTNPVGYFNAGHAGVGAALTQVKGIVPAGLSIYVTDITVQSTTATAGTAWALRSGTGTDCATGTTAVYPVSSTSESWGFYPGNTAAQMTIRLLTPLKLADGHALCAIGVGTNLLRIQATGYVAP